MTRSEQKEKRRNEILSAGLDVFIRKGYAATKIQDIAQKADMSTGLMFHYFESKEKLYEELIRIGISGPMSLLSKEMSEPIEFFEQSVKEIFHLIKTQSFVAKMFVLMSQVKYNDGITDTVKELLRDIDIMSETVELILKGQQNGTIRDGEPKALSVAFWAAVTGTAQAVALGGDIPIPECEWIMDIIRKR